MFELYKDQRESVQKVQAAFRAGFRAPLLWGATGSGKTVMAGHMMQLLHAHGKSALVLVHREELLDQFLTTITDAGLGLEFGLVVAGQSEKSWLRHHIGMVQTLVKRLHRVTFEPDLIVIDEAHHSRAKTYQNIIKRWPKARRLGLTATPERPDGQPLRPIFDVLVEGPSVRWLIQNTRLAPYRYKLVETALGEMQLPLGHDGDYQRKALAEAVESNQKVIADVLKVIEENCRERSWIAFGPSVRGSQMLEAKLREKGWRVKHIDGSTPKQERRNALEDFRRGVLDGLLTVDLFIEGVDCPAADCAVIYRKTKSHVVFLQICGRVLRYQEGKIAMILDAAGSGGDDGLGFPCDKRVWNLDGRCSVEKGSSTGVKVCPQCFLTQPVYRTNCSSCGFKFGQAPKDIKEVELQLIEIPIGPDGVMVERRSNGAYTKSSVKAALREAYRNEGQEGIFALARQLGYKVGWARRMLDLRHMR